MTRRERHMHILVSFGRAAEFHRTQLIYQKGYEALTDEAVEEIARRTVSSQRRQQKFNAEARDMVRS